MACRILGFTMNWGMGRAFFVAVALAVGITLPGAAKATTVIYDLTLTPVPHTGTSLFGSGILTLDEDVNPSGFETFHHNSSHVESLTITIDGIVFDLTHSFSSITFHNGVLSSIFATGKATKGDDDALLVVGFLGTALAVGDDIDDKDKDKHKDRDDLLAFDFISATLDPPSIVATPLPATWSLMMLGFAVVGFAAYRGRKNRTLAAAA